MVTRRFLEPRSGRGMFTDAQPRSRPTIVLLTIDMVPPDFYRPGETNSGLASTPTLDRLRAEGVTFTNAFTNSPLCGPSRASYLTGRYPYVIVNTERAHDGWAVTLRPEDVIFPEYLKAVGYVTKHVGKSHIGPEKFIEAFGEADVPWDRWAPPMQDDDGYVAYLRRLLPSTRSGRGQSAEPRVTQPTYRNPVRGLRFDRKTPGNLYGGFVTQADGSPFPEGATYLAYQAELVRERLDGAMEQGLRDGAPLYLQVDFFAPHQPFMIPAGYEKRAEALRKRVKVPASFHEVRKHDFRRLPGEPPVYELYRRQHGLYDEATVRNYILFNILQMELLDRALGNVLAALEERGLYDQALVILIADHGEMNGENALVDKGVYGHPRVARVPFIAKLPGSSCAGAQVRTPICLLDLAPTVLEAAGVSPAARLDGLSLWPLLRRRGSRAALAKRTFLFEACWHVVPNPAVSIQWQKSATEHYFYTYNLTSECDELYDLSDPTYRNLAPDPAYRKVTHEMVLRLAHFLQADPRWRCYWHPLRIARAEHLPLEPGDYQMFRPE